MILPDRRAFEEMGAATVPVLLTVARHWPPPSASRLWACAIFDSIQDVCKNNDRVGLRAPVADVLMQEDDSPRG